MDSATRIVAHNAKFDLIWLISCGIDISHYRVFCTQVAEYLLRGQKRGPKGSLALETLSKHYGIPEKIDKVKIFWESGYETDEIPASILCPYGEQDCLNALAIYQKQANSIGKQGAQSLFALQFELSKVLAEIEYNGMLVDEGILKHYSKEYGEQLESIDAEISDICRHYLPKETHDCFNFNSGDHVSALLYGGVLRVEGREEYERVLKSGEVKVCSRKAKIEYPIRGMGFTPVEGTELAKAGYYATDLETLKSLKCPSKDHQTLIRNLIERSRIEKLKGTYFDGLLERSVKDFEGNSYVHPSLNQTVTVTGRLSSSNPNGQNFPRGGTGPVKEIFITRYKED